MNRFLLLLKSNLVDPFVRSFQRFYETVSFALLMMLIADIIILVDNSPLDEVLWDIIGSGWIVLFLLAAWTLWVERFQYQLSWRWLGDGVILLVGIAHYFLAPTAASEFVEITRYIGLLLLAMFAFLVAPYFMRREGFSLYVLYVDTKFLVTGFYSLVLWGGLSAILATIEGLFSVSIDEKIYMLIIATILGLVTAPVFLGQVPDKAVEMVPEAMNKIWKTVFSTIVLPLVMVFTVILIIYVLTSLIPNSPYDSLIYMSSSLGLAVVGIITLFIMDPFRDQLAHVKFYLTYWPFALLAVFVGFYSEVIRSISEMGFSAVHGYFLLAGVFAPSVAIVYILRHPRRIIFTILIAMDTTLLVTLLPFANAIAVTRYAVNAELRQLLNENGMLVNGEIVAQPSLDEAIQGRVSNLILRASEVGFQSIGVLPDDFMLEDFEDVFGFTFDGVWNPIDDTLYYTFMFDSMSLGIDTSAFDYVMIMPTLQNEVAGPYTLVWNRTSGQLTVSGTGMNVVVDFDDIATQLRPLSLNGQPKDLTLEELTFVTSSGSDTVTIFFRSINFEYDTSAQTYGPYFADFVVAITDN